MKLFNINVCAILIALVSGASLFFYTPAFLIVFVIAAFASTNSVTLSKDLRHLIWTIAIFSVLAAASLHSEAQQQIPSIFLWCAVSIVFCIVFSCISLDVICRSILVFNMIFVCFEFNLIWMFLNMPESDPSNLVRSLDSPVLVVPNDFAYFAVVIPLLVLACRHLFNGVGVNLFLAGILILYLTVSLILESRLAIIEVAIIVGSEFAGKLEKQYRPWVILAVSIATLAIISLILQKGSYSLETRLALWAAAISGIIEDPFVGHGFGAFGSYYDQFKATGFESLSFTLNVDQRYIPWPHNLLIELVFNYGLSGIFPVLMFFRAAAENLRRGFRLDGTVFQLLLVLGLLTLLEMSLLRIQTIPIILIVWVSLFYSVSTEHHSFRGLVTD